ncbi:hypothetical protein [Burkholderia multivorans]|uniref:hypothetical protein n=1 Tax=Burkholderia multivorans TaxID=87883 RepID=UPI0020B2259C|nr:hypothetical protein [Burkholderia multivorans]
MLVLTHVVDADEAEIVVTPGVELQNLLWSFDSGYSGQWSGRELRILTGCSDWDSLLKQTSDTFRRVCGTVQAAVEGTLGKPATRPEPTLTIAVTSALTRCSSARFADIASTAGESWSSSALWLR